MTDSINGSVDFLEPEFLHSLGIAVATFAYLEEVLKHAFFAAKHQSQDYASYPESAIEIHEADFSSKTDKVFKALSAKIEDAEAAGMPALQEEFHKSRQARNFIVHGVWLRGKKDGFYRCSMIDRAGRTVLNEADRDVILSEATRAEHLMIKLKTLLVAEGLYPAVGPKIAPRQ